MFETTISVHAKGSTASAAESVSAQTRIILAMDEFCPCGRPPMHNGRCRGPKRLYENTPETDNLIREAYEKLRKYGNRRALPTLGAKLRWPKHIINKRGRELGLARTKEKPWSSEEKALLEKWAHLSLKRISLKLRRSGFSRSETGIKLKLTRMLLTKDTLGYYSPTKIALAMGIDGHKVMGWIRRGWLRAERKGSTRTAQQGGDIYLVRTQELTRFLLNHPDEYELGPVEKFWFLDAISGGRLCQEYRGEVA
jgi:hypothetical protein